MDGPKRDVDRIDAESEELREVVPVRAVLTELARGFLLAQHSDPDRAVRFLETFLREQTHPPAPTRVDLVPRPPFPRLPVGPFSRGAVEPNGAASQR
ncbi:MAG TPA: hypothetical protein VEH57_01360 [Thermoplasmata archaeon]|nr:hypothetical protein [Thermoplasmata archaeon]